MDLKTQNESRLISDAELFSRIAKLQVDALSALYDRYAGQLYGLACKILKDNTQAEDVLQELFVFIWENADKFDRKRGASLAWLTVLCRNRCIDKLRSNTSKVRRTTPIAEVSIKNIATDDADDPWQSAAYNETRNKVRDALRRLPAEQRETILLAYFEGLSQSEIAERLKIPHGTIKTRIRLGMQKLRYLLESERH
jgi:RNA polymerase sigma-70 factor (ECF subfamily)